MLAFSFFTDLFNSLNGNISTLANGMNNLFSVIMPALSACFVVYVVFVIFSYWQSESTPHQIFLDMLKRFLMLGLLIGLGLNMSTYTSTVFPVITDLGNDLASTWSGGSNTTSASLDKIAEKIGQITDTNSSDAEATEEPNTALPTTTPQPTGVIDTVIDAVGGATDAVFSATIGKLGNTIVVHLQNFIIWISSGLFLIIAAAFLLVANVMLVILAAVAPLFLAFGIFPATRSFFNNWIGQVLGNAFLFLTIQITVNIFVIFIDGQLDNMVNTIKAGELAVTFNSLMVLIVMFGVFAVVLLQLPQLTGSLFSGLASGGYSDVKGAVKKNAGMVFGGGRWGINKWQNRNRGEGGKISPENNGK